MFWLYVSFDLSSAYPLTKQGVLEPTKVRLYKLPPLRTVHVPLTKAACISYDQGFEGWRTLEILPRKDSVQRCSLQPPCQPTPGSFTLPVRVIMAPEGSPSHFCRLSVVREFFLVSKLPVWPSKSHSITEAEFLQWSDDFKGHTHPRTLPNYLNGRNWN